MNIDKTIDEIITDFRFKRLKTVIENNSYHNNEAVFDHVLKVFKKAKESILGSFIKDTIARKKFINFTNETIYGIKRKDAMLIAAILHDIAKGTKYKDGVKEQEIKKIDKNGFVLFPNHEYIGSILASQILKDKGLSKDITDYICKIIKLHGVFSEFYFDDVKNWSEEEIINDIKNKSEGIYIETLFNVYCDCFDAVPFQKSKQAIEKVFNNLDLYSERIYHF